MSESSFEKLVLEEFTKIRKEINDIKILNLDRSVRDAEYVVLSTNIRELLTRFNNADVDNVVNEKANKSGAKKKSKKNKNAVNTIEELEYIPEKGRSYRYNVYVNMIKNSDDFAKRITISWSKLDPTVSEDPEQVDYIKFFQEFMSKKVECKDITDTNISKLRKELIDETRKIMKEESELTKKKVVAEEKKKKKEKEESDDDSSSSESENDSGDSSESSEEEKDKKDSSKRGKKK